MRMPNFDDDGQMAPQTITNLTRMAVNLSGQARVCIDQQTGDMSC
jgi:hypothetical protein